MASDPSVTLCHLPYQLRFSPRTGEDIPSCILLRMIKPWSFSATPMGSVWGGCFLPTAEAVGYANRRYAATAVRASMWRGVTLSLCGYDCVTML